MKKFMILLFPVLVFAILFALGVNSLANGFEDPASANNTLSEPINILFVGFSLIALGSFVKKRIKRSE